MEKPDRFPDVMLLAPTLGPEAMLPLAGRPLIEWPMRGGRAEGATRFVASVPEPTAPVLAHFGGLIKVDRQIDSADQADHIRAALPLLVSDPFFVIATQVVWASGSDRPLARMRARRKGPGDIVLLCAQPARATGFGRSHDFCLDPSGLVTRDYGAPVLSCGVALLDRAAFAGDMEDGLTLEALLDRAMDDERLHGVVLDAPVFNVGSAAGLAAAEEALAP